MSNAAANEVKQYVVKEKQDGELVDLCTLFRNADGTFSNKQKGIALDVSGEYPRVLRDGKSFGTAFNNTSKASGKPYIAVKDENKNYTHYLFPSDGSKKGAGGPKR